jgi:hypothetical protein
MCIGLPGNELSMDMFDSPSEKKMSKISSGYDMQIVLNPLQPKEISDIAHLNTILHQVLSLIPRYEFKVLARK